MLKGCSAGYDTTRYLCAGERKGKGKDGVHIHSLIEVFRYYSSRIRSKVQSTSDALLAVAMHIQLLFLVFRLSATNIN